MSSAHKTKFVGYTRIQFGRSVMWMRNNMGPRMEHQGGNPILRSGRPDGEVFSCIKLYLCIQFYISLKNSKIERGFNL